MPRPYGLEVYQYDRVPFRSVAVPHADCRRIETIARLFGLTAAPCAHARVLELGCGSAANLIPLALAYPRAHFVGCDLSQSALASAQRLIDGLGLTNVGLRHADICDVDEGWGAFDYILCHDVFSWVAPDVRQKILDILSRQLAPRGVGYVSIEHAGLHYLSDADVTRLFGPREPAAVRGFLDALPRLEQQQYLDFVTNCMYRGALVCHRDVEIHDRPEDSVLRDVCISLTTARGELLAPDREPGSAVQPGRQAS